MSPGPAHRGPTPAAVRVAAVRVAALVAALVVAVTALAVALPDGPALAHPAPGAPAPGTPASAEDAASRLAVRYAPVVVIRTQDVPCGDGEPYLPVPVDVVLGRDDVVLRGPDGVVVTTAPTATDLAGLGDGYYLDLPGDPLAPGCDYETWAREASAGVGPSVYARLAGDPDRPGQLVLQYWVFWVFNDWNDKHEGDWEMVQLLFDADTAEQALAAGPTTIAFAQHEGAQVADWSDPAILRDGDHPAVYPGQGSHAAYPTQAQWFGKSAAAGFGCDDTTAPGTVLRPTVILLPEDAATAEADLAWVRFTGRWGQKEPSFNNGPTGPVAKAQWEHPVTWVEEEGRTDADALPPLPGEAVDAFCGLVAAGSLLFVDVLDAPVVVGLLIVAALALVVVAVRRTRWWPAVADPVDTSRRSGQVVTSALRLYGSRTGLFLPLTGLVLLAGITVTAVQTAILAPRPTGNLADVDGTTDGWPHLAAALVGVVVIVPVTAWVCGAVAWALAQVAAGRSPGGVHALRASAVHPSGALTAVVQATLPAALAATVLGVPVAAWLVARWAAAFPAAATEDLGVRAALRRSRTLTRGHRWRTLALTLTALAAAGWTGPVLGALLLLTTGLPFWAANLVAAVVGAFGLPVAATALSLQYEDLRARSVSPEAAPAPRHPEGASP